MSRPVPQIAIDFIKKEEGFRAEPYQDGAGVWTVGYGHTRGVTEDTHPITEEAASSILADEIAKFAHAVETYVSTDLNDNQFSALISLVYNVGATPLQMTMGKLLNAGQLDAAANEFLKWVYIHKHNEDGELVPVESRGLKNRRVAERALFLEPI